MRNKKTAFTLLEVILAMALAALVMAALSMAVNLHLRSLDSGRTKVEEAQLARAIMRIIARDLRAAVPFKANNSSQGSPGGSSGQQTTSMQTGAASPQTGQTTVRSTTDESGMTEEDRTAGLCSASPQSVPGLYGNAYELQIDISRLPRADQFLAVSNQITDATNADQVSDLKNVSYFTIDNSAALTPGMASGGTVLYGLARREVSRATGSYAAQQSQLTATEENLEVLAPEVEAIEFLYYDGIEWVSTWDSVSQSALPAAVQISISIKSQQSGLAADVQSSIYRLTVDIPAAKSASQTISNASTTSTSNATE